MSRLRIVFMGTPELACASLNALLGCDEFEVAGVVTQPDRPKGRDLKVQASPVKELAARKGLTVLQPERSREEGFIESLRRLEPQLIAVAAYGQILPKTILDLPAHGCLNVHTSLLPRYRGAAPIQLAILNDDRETGVTIMKMDAGMDTGAIVSQQATAISPEDDAQTLHDRLAAMGAELLVKTIPDYVAGKIQPRPQPETGIVYAPKIKKEDGEIDWSLPARTIWNHVRGLVPWPGTFTFLSETSGKTLLLKIWEAKAVEGSGSPGTILKAGKEGVAVACGTGALQILTVQKEGGRRMAVQEFLAGNSLSVGQSFLQK
jgi:methionyl-tRNA formyltransferase